MSPTVCASIQKFIVFGLLLITQVASEAPLKCHRTQRCIPSSSCGITNPDALIFPCHNGLNMICCSIGLFSNDVAVIENKKAALFPLNCGTVITSDKISGGKNADLGQFPWMALLGYKQRGVDFTQFLCGGSIITEYYLVTAAHCLSLDKRLELTVARVGEHDLFSDRDCVKVDKTETCADSPVDIPVDRRIPHPNYSNRNLQNDIALIKLREKITFTDYVKPVCLPFARNLETADLAAQKLVVSGWGKINASDLGGSTILQFTSVTVWNQDTCEKKIPPEVRPLQNNQLCANGPKTEDACKGDSGGPLVNATVDRGGDLRFFQIGIVSFASTLTCGDPTLPTVYTRIDKYLKWIVENID